MTYHNAIKYVMTAPTDLSEDSVGANLKRLWNELGNPQKGLTYFRLAGNNGKSVCAELLMSAFRDSSHQVGCFTTPIQEDIRNNIRINGGGLPFEEFCGYVDRIYRIQARINKTYAKEAAASDPQENNAEATPSAFVLTQHEIMLSAALLAFHANNCTLCMMESDHTQADPSRFLPAPFAAAICGTIPSTDRKAVQRIRSYICHGIQEVISAPQDQDAYRVISDTCAAINCRLTLTSKSEIQIHRIALNGSEFSYRDKPYRLGLCGKFQISNATVALEILEVLARRGFPLTEQQIQEGFRKTKIPAKFEFLSIAPTIIVDSTHSDIAIETVCDSMAEFRELLGNKVRLCLPSGSIVERYRTVLQQKGYEITEYLTFPAELLVEPSLSPYSPKQKTIVEVAKKALTTLKDNEILLISGPYCFTSAIRAALVKALSF
ncbi:MAG: hypothetical protein IJW50_08575 [Clostridia bacterium]|nr:hypothetical protein [Clostridia bacterium]